MLCWFLFDQAIQTDQSITRQQVQSDVSIDKVKQAGLRLAGVLLSPVSEQGRPVAKCFLSSLLCLVDL